MSISYLVISNINVSDCNLESSYITASYPITAAAGFIEKILRICRENIVTPNKATWVGTLEKFAVIVHDYQQYEGITKNPTSMCRGNGTQPHLADIANPPIVTEIKGKVNFSLIITLEDSEIEHLSEVINNKLKSEIFKIRFAGGDILSIGEKKQELEESFIFNKSEIENKIKSLRFGYYITDRSNLLNKDDRCPLSRLIDGLLISLDSDGKYSKLHPEEFKGWLFALPVGFHLLEAPTKRRLIRGSNFAYNEETLHAFCEPMIGMAELLSSFNVTKLLNETEVNNLPIFWKWNSKKDCTYLTGF